MTNRAIIVGSSGLIGSKLLTILLNKGAYDEILVIARKKTKVTNPKLTQLIVDFEHLDDYADKITGDVIFCCLGSTRKKTPDLKEYRKIDHDYPLELAEIALKNGIGEYHFISAINADAGSSNFYTKMKGETEEDLKKVGLTSLYIYQPSLLTGHRKTPRFAERMAIGLMKVINPFLWGGLKKYRSIPAQTVALAMYRQSLKPKNGVFIHTSDKIKQIA